MECTTGAKVFREAGIVHVDWLDLDAEGHEWHILKGLDFSEVVIDIISVEANHEQMAKYLQGIGLYVLPFFFFPGAGIWLEGVADKPLRGCLNSKF